MITADRIRAFNRPPHALFRAFDHAIGASLGMTLMVPLPRVQGRLTPLVDQCPVPALEAAAILEVSWEEGSPLPIDELVRHASQIKRPLASGIAGFAFLVLDEFIGQDGLLVADEEWRHQQIYTSKGVEPCRLFIGKHGTRFAFVPDFLEGVLG